MRTNEDQLQEACVKWFDVVFGQTKSKLLFAIPNGGLRSPKTARNLKRTGVRSGVADLCFLYRGTALFIEMKYGKNRQQETQREWQSLIESQGFKYIVCRSFDDFRKIIATQVKLIDEKLAQ